LEREHLARPFAQSVERQTLHRNIFDLMCGISRPFSLHSKAHASKMLALQLKKNLRFLNIKTIDGLIFGTVETVSRADGFFDAFGAVDN